MRLLNTLDLTLHEFLDGDIPEYAILSHTWSKDEVLFQDLSKEQRFRESKRGFQKVKQCCQRAAQDGFRWVWIDTLCIDKNSSAELSEAINSMFRWYEMSAVCYAYLEDLNVVGSLKVDQKIGQCKWFRRGWTLQELIAPSTVEFFDRNWTYFGSKISLQERISRVTAIPVRALLNVPLSQFNVAERMSWASNRYTKREEDHAYCLMGLFNINMPMLYGEGRRRAFLRLQQEIMRTSEDYTIFLWNEVYSEPRTALLASTPRAFTPRIFENLLRTHEVSIPEVQQSCYSAIEMHSPTYGSSSRFSTILSGKESLVPEVPSWTGRGLRITLPMMKSASSESWLAFLYCSVGFSGHLLCANLKAVELGKGTFIRDGPLQLVHFADYHKFKPITIHVDWWDWNDHRWSTEHSKARVRIQFPKCMSVTRHYSDGSKLSLDDKDELDIRLLFFKNLGCISVLHQHDHEPEGYFEVILHKHMNRAGIALKTDRDLYNNLEDSLIPRRRLKIQAPWELPDQVTEQLLSMHLLHMQIKRVGGTWNGDAIAFVFQMSCTTTEHCSGRVTEQFQSLWQQICSRDDEYCLLS